MRNPWARMWSWYSMIQQRGESIAAGDAWVKQRIERNRFWSGVLREVPDFEAFVMHGPELFPRLRVPQVRYLRTPEQARPTSSAAPSTLDRDLAPVCERLGIEPPAVVPRENASRQRRLPQPLHPRHARPGRRAARPRLEEFGYTFD